MMRRLQFCLGSRANVERVVEQWGASALAMWVREAKTSANKVRTGDIIDYEGKVYRVEKYALNSGKAQERPYVKVTLRDLNTSVKLERKMGVDASVDIVDVATQPFNFLYEDKGTLYFMNQEDYETVSFDKELFGSSADFLGENMEVEVQYFNGQAVSGKLPKKVELVVEQTDPSIPGETRASSYKPAKLSNGAEVRVPPYISQGERIIVATDTGEFVQRAK
eukprot:TRINITY_DN3967_c0_g2_i2.p2 TRINITY_DN3967_c0_g2~~TRINITY_DN3967_c0_g2_i2.p2  ORF type:complete len:222 (-),score=35.12 TRINITY_DN3967_c0_g2_i2:209-874(-)